MARPRKAEDERRTTQLPPVRMTEAERVHVEDQAARAGLPVSDFARRVVLGYRVAPARSAADDRLLLELNRIGVNMNQIARNLNSDRPENIDLSEVLAELKRVLAVAAADGP